MKIGTIAIFLSLFLIGCGKKTEQDIPITDAAEKGIEKEDREIEKVEKENIQENSEKKISQYFYLEACEEMVDLKLSILEKSYQEGKVSKDEYRMQKQQLKQEENQYQLEREALGYQENLYAPVHIQDSDKKAMKKRLLEVKEEIEDLAKKMKKTKQDYIEQRLSQEDFILKRSKQEEEEERLEQEEDWLKKNLEK
ncbi:MAG: hypothetical protein HFJ09_00290 [Lachnospiraceae bacterium]|nr:hypothetical protein [Lachnospiraceae bacterium]